jgi:cytidyltransferase-like protein
MNLLNLPPKCRQNAIIYYCGSFDPAHEGHLSTLKSAMEKTQAIGAVVIVAMGENSDKPNRSSWEVRRQTAIELFRDLDGVCVSPWGKEETKTYLFERAHVINLMGEDIWEHYRTRTTSDFQTICIGLRHSENASYTTNLKDKEIIYTLPVVQGCSSSKIRNYLTAHPELYEGAPRLPGTILDRLPLREFEYILLVILVCKIFNA